MPLVPLHLCHAPYLHAHPRVLKTGPPSSTPLALPGARPSSHPRSPQPSRPHPPRVPLTRVAAGSTSSLHVPTSHPPPRVCAQTQVTRRLHCAHGVWVTRVSSALQVLSALEAAGCGHGQGFGLRAKMRCHRSLYLALTLTLSCVVLVHPLQAPPQVLFHVALAIAPGPWAARAARLASSPRVARARSAPAPRFLTALSCPLSTSSLGDSRRSLSSSLSRTASRGAWGAR